MPELPEMEHYKRVLTPRLAGKMITSVDIEREKSINFQTDQFRSRVAGQKITSIERRAKYLCFHLSGGNGLLVHLMLGGKLFFGKPEESPDHSKQVTLHFGSEALFFIGLRLGYLHLVTPDELEKEWAKLGPDPLSPELSNNDFCQRLKLKGGRLKAALVDQSIVSGIGNRYSDEICFEAKLHPGRDAHALNQSECHALFSAIHDVLIKGIELGGYLDMPVFPGDQRTGGAVKAMNVRGRAGEPCPRCGTRIVEETISSKKTSYCPNCQH